MGPAFRPRIDRRPVTAVGLDDARADSRRSLRAGWMRNKVLANGPSVVAGAKAGHFTEPALKQSIGQGWFVRLEPKIPGLREIDLCFCSLLFRSAEWSRLISFSVRQGWSATITMGRAG